MVAELFRERDAAQIERIPAGVEASLQRVEDQLCAARGRQPAPAIIGVCVDLNLKPAGKDAIAARSGDELAVVKHCNGNAAGEKVGSIRKATLKIGRPFFKSGRMIEHLVKQTQLKLRRETVDIALQRFSGKDVRFLFDRVAEALFRTFAPRLLNRGLPTCVTRNNLARGCLCRKRRAGFAHKEAEITERNLRGGWRCFVVRPIRPHVPLQHGPDERFIPAVEQRRDLLQ